MIYLFVVAERGYKQETGTVGVAREQGIPGWAGAVTGVLKASSSPRSASSLAAWAVSVRTVS